MNNYFRLEEFLKSDTALENKISNLPSWEIINNLTELRDFLNPLREAWGSAIIVTSGFRCKELNNMLIYASKSSVHMIGYAVDMIPANGKFEEFKSFLYDYLKDKNYDQCIVESSGKSRWIHLGLYNNNHEQRKLWMTLTI